MAKGQREITKAVKAGYWHLYRYNPNLQSEGKNPFSLDSKEPDFELFQDFLRSEVRYSSLAKLNPEQAEELFAKSLNDAREGYEGYKKRSEG
jgi:pyruvate-ferredoxin/flavodoxin oxidoreductase